MGTRSAEGSTRRLLELCAGYFVAYVGTGVLVKYFTVLREPRMTDIAYLVNNTIGSAAVVLLLVLALGWVRIQSNRMVTWAGVRVPSELAYLIPSGICTAVVIPATTMMYTLPISVLVAMVIMRGSIIVVSRLVDAVQIRQGILHKQVYAEENWAVVFALLAVATNVLWSPSARNAAAGWGLPGFHPLPVTPGRGDFEFLQSGPAMIILISYIIAYTIRIYIMNYYKNTRAPGVKQDNKGFFAIEQVVSCIVMFAAGALVTAAPVAFGATDVRLVQFRAAVLHLEFTPVLSGLAFGAAAFFSVFLFMFHGRTATFAGLVNRLTSLVAGTVATLLLALFAHTKYPGAQDWVSLGFILIAVMFLTRAERKRAVAIAPAPAAAVRLATTP